MSYTWTQDPIVPGTTVIKAIDVNELRTNINAELARRGGAQQTWYGTITADQTRVRKVHIDELRSALEYANAIPPIYCRSNTPFTVAWSQPIVADQTKIRAIHIEELRQYTDNLSNNCPCDCNGPCNCNCNSPCSYCPHCDQGCCHWLGGR